MPNVAHQQSASSISVSTLTSKGSLLTVAGRFLCLAMAVLCALDPPPASAASLPTTIVLSVKANGQVVSSVSRETVITLAATVNVGATPLTLGQVNFCDASVTSCTDIHLLGTAQLNSSGVAQIRFRPGIGSNSYKAVFLGTKSYTASSSSSSVLTVTGTVYPLSTASSIARTGSWGNYSLTGSVTETGGTVAPTGTFSFLDSSNGNVELASAPLGVSTPGLTWLNSPAPTEFVPHRVATGDFNGDGVPDLVVTNRLLSSFVILLGKGDGTFFTATSVNPGTGVGPDTIAVGDFNNDGIQDLAIGNTSSSKVSILLGIGDGTFSSAVTTLTTSFSSTSIAVADLNGDGNLDLIVTPSYGTTVNVFLGKGDGTFTNPASSPAVASPGVVAVGDFNGDGIPDLAISSNTNNTTYNTPATIAILLGKGDGTFTAAASLPMDSYSNSLVVADLNGDGKLDLVEGNGINLDGGSTTLAIFLGNGDGTFARTTTSPTTIGSPQSIAVADFNADGKPDLVVTNYSSNGGVNVFLGNGDGTFATTPLSLSTGSSPTSVATADFDGDGRADVAVATTFNTTATVLLTKPTQTATATSSVSLSGVGQHWTIARYSGDSNYTTSASGTTMVWGASPTTTTVLTVTTGGATATEVVAGSVVTLTATVKAGTTALASGQVNFCDASASNCSDIHLLGTAELTSSGTAALKFVPGVGVHTYKAVLVQSGVGASSSSTISTLTVTAASTITYPTTTTIAQSGTVGNYTLTATVTETGGVLAPSGNVSFLDTSYAKSVMASASLGSNSAGLTWVNSQSLSVGQANSNPCANAVGDFDGDGISDLVVVDSNQTSLFIFLGNGDGTFRTVTGPALGGYFSKVLVGDFNGDGKADLAVMNSTQIVILLGNGDGTFTQAAGSPIAVSGYAESIAIGDFNLDGRLDLVAANNSGAMVTVLLGNGDGTFTSVSSNLPTQRQSIFVVVGDFNGDGTFTQVGSLITLNYWPTSMVVADFNSDGKLDLAMAANIYSSSIVILLGNGDGTFTQAANSPVSAGNYPGYIVATDFNRDGKVDLAVSNSNNSMNTLFLGNGDGSFILSPAAPPTGYGPGAIAVGDFNGDGVPDLAEINEGSIISILLTKPTETASATASGISLTGPAPHLIDASYAGDSHYNASVSGTTSLSALAATPVLSVASGTYTTIQSLAITDSTPGVTIYYTTNGTVPSTNSAVYTGPIPILAKTNSIQAIAMETGYVSSAVGTANYTLNLPAPVAPVISQASGVYSGTQTVTISDATPNTVIYYTTNGTTPTMSSPVYIGAISVSASETVVAIAAYGYALSTPVSAQYTISGSTSSFIYTVAGNNSWGYAGDGGAATVASLNSPWATVIDSSGNLYISDTGNNMVRKVDATTGMITTVAGTGIAGFSGDNGLATSAQLTSPEGLAIDSAGNLYIADNGNHLVRKIAVGTGIITTYAGNRQAYAFGDGGSATSAYLSAPTGIALDGAGNLYIATQVNQVRKVTASSGIITTVAGDIYGRSGYSGDTGLATSAALASPQGIAVDKAGNLFIADTQNDVIREVTASTGVIDTVAGYNYYRLYAAQDEGFLTGDGGLAINARLNLPYGVAVDGAGNLYIADTSNMAVRVVTAKDGIINTIAGVQSNGVSQIPGVTTHLGICTSFSGDGGPANNAEVCSPQGVTLDGKGNIYIAESASHRVRKMTAAISSPVTTTAAPSFSISTGTYGGSQTVSISDATPGAEIYVTFDGNTPSTALQTAYHGPISITSTATLRAIAIAPGYLPSSDVSATYTITAPPTKLIRTLAGNGISGSSGVGGLASSAQIGSPNGVVVDASGNTYIADPTNRVVWMVSAVTGKISVVAGTLGVQGSSPYGVLATSSSLYYPSHVALDNVGNLYISDSWEYAVYKVTAQTGIIDLYAGGAYASSSGNVGDGGPATSAYIYSPQGLALDSAGNLYIADEYNNRIRMVSASSGIISTVAGGVTTSLLGDGGLAISAALLHPTDVAINSSGDMYIADTGHGRVRLVTANTGTIMSVAGNGDTGASGDGGLATAAEVDPMGVAVDGAGNLYIANPPYALRMVAAGSGIITTITGNGYEGFSGDGGLPTQAQLCAPGGVGLDKAGSLYLADTCNNRVRMVYSATAAATPVLSLASGSYIGPRSVTITSATANSVIYYTTDGSTPTASSAVYSGAITVSTAETLKALAVASGYTNSAIATAAYAITLQTATPTFSLAAGTYSSSQTVTISDTTSGATIYYTADGSTPTSSSTRYTTAITVSATETLQAIAAAASYSTSALASATYTISIPTNSVPAISGISPTFTKAGGSAFTLTVNGAGFIASSTIYWGNTALATTYVNATQLTAQIPATDIAAPGTIAITAVTPAPGGGTSNTLQFEVDTASSAATAPTITSTTATVAAGSTATYPVTIPSGVTSVSVTCLNLPLGATCSYSSTTSTLTIATSSTTPKGVYLVTAVFTETVSGAASGFILLPILLLPMVVARKRLTTYGIWPMVCLGLVLLASASMMIGCGGGGGSSSTTSPATHQATSSGTISLTVQ